MNDTRRGRGPGRSRGGGTHQHQQSHRTEESSWTVVKPSPDHHNSTEIDDVGRRGQFRVDQSHLHRPFPSSKSNLRGTGGGSGRRGSRARNRNRRKEVSDMVVGDGVESGEVVEVEGVEIEVERREEEGVDVDGRVEDEEERVGKECCEGCDELEKNEDVIFRRLEELRLGCQEKELTEDEFSVNDQLQDDEVRWLHEYL